MYHFCFSEAKGKGNIMNEVVVNTPETVPSAEIQNLSDYLNDISTRVPKLHLSILPNIVSDCATVFMEYKKMKIDNKQFNKKCKLINDYIQGQSRNQKMSIEFNHEQKMHEIDTYKTTKLAELDVKKEVSISKIENDTLVALEKIRSNEKIQIMELRADYELKRREQEKDLRKFQENLKEESRRFNKQYQMTRYEQADRHRLIKDLQKTCSYINKKIVNGRANTRDIEYCKHLMDLQIMAFKEGFNFIQSVCTIFSEENAD